LFTSVIAANPGSKLLLWLVIFAIAMSAVSLFYYLRVLKSAYVADPPAEAGEIQSPLLIQVVVGLLAGSVVILGCAPDLLLTPLLNVIHASGL
jgi:NADH-quinone oxidoreductase subunit N